MSTQAHTPGPWYVNELTPHKKIVQAMCIASNDGPVTFMQTTSKAYVDKLWSNAKLIAAAPSMYNALKAISNMQITENTDKSEVLSLCMSIAKIALEKSL